MIQEHVKTFKNYNGQEDDYTTDFLMNYPYFKRCYKMIAKKLSKQKAVDADPEAMQQINFTENLDWTEGATIFFITEVVKETILDFSQGIVSVL